MTIKDLAATATLSRKKESCGKIALKRWKKKVISNAAVLGTSPSSVVWINADFLCSNQPLYSNETSLTEILTYNWIGFATVSFGSICDY